MSAHRIIAWGGAIAAFGLILFVLGTARAAVPGPLVDSAWLKANLETPGLVVLDIRGGETAVDDFKAAHVPSAVHSNYGDWRTARGDIVGVLPEVSSLEALIGGLGIANDSTVVIVPAGSGASEFGAAARVHWTLKYLGHDDVAILDGGWNAWSADAENPVANGETSVTAATFKSDPRPEILASTADVAGEVGTDAVLVDARPAEQFIGDAKHPKADRAGHVPGAVNVDQASFYDPENNRLKSSAEISSMIPASLKADGADVVSYCNTGHWAATNWFVMSEVLGLKKVRLYDESMVGWSQDASLPIATGAN